MNTILDKNLIVIKDELSKILPQNADVFLFGSRATGKNKSYSDYDIGIQLNNGKALDYDLFLELKGYFDEFPFNIDIVDFNNVSEGFKKIAGKHTILLQSKA